MCHTHLCRKFLYIDSPWPEGHLHGLNGSALDHRSLPPRFQSWHGHIGRVVHLRLCLITIGGCSAYLADLVHKGGHKTSIINFPQPYVPGVIITKANQTRRSLIPQFVFTRFLFITKDQTLFFLFVSYQVNVMNGIITFSNLVRVFLVIPWPS